MTDKKRAALQAALEVLEYLESQPHVRGKDDCYEDLIAEIRAALAEQSPKMPSDTRYTVAVEGQAPTYWDNIHDAITDAQRAVYAGVDNLTNAINDLQGGRIAEWSYGFSAVRIYPPQKRAALAEQGAEPDELGTEWTPCVKRPITVHVRSQRPDETHVSTREGITPVKPDDLIMRGVDGEEYPIGRSLFDRTYLVGVGRVKQAALSMHGKSIESAEPVAWLIPGSVTRDADLAAANGTNAVPLYAAPPRREWQSLTDEEMYAAYESAPTRWDRHIRGLRAIEAALKERNT